MDSALGESSGVTVTIRETTGLDDFEGFVRGAARDTDDRIGFPAPLDVRARAIALHTGLPVMQVLEALCEGRDEEDFGLTSAAQVHP